MKVSISLPEVEVEFLDQYATSQGIGSRSAAVHKAIRLLRASELGPAYEAAWDDWAASDDRELWDAATGDGSG